MSMMKQMTHPAALAIVLLLSVILYSGLPDEDMGESVHVMPAAPIVHRPRALPSSPEAILRAGIAAGGSDAVRGHMHLGNVLAVRGAWSEARDAYRSAAQFATVHRLEASAYMAASNLEFRLGNPLEARQMLKKTAKPMVYMEYEIESFEEYADYLSIVIERDLIRARMQMSAGQARNAEISVEDAMDGFDTISNAELYDGSKIMFSDPVLEGKVETAKCARRLMSGELDAAVLSCGRALGFLKGNERADTLQLLGDVHAESGDSVLAERRYNEALRVGSPSPKSVELRLHRLRRDVPALEKLLHELRGEDDYYVERVEIQMALVDLALGAGEGSKALAHLDALDSVAPLDEVQELARVQRLTMRAAAQLAQSREERIELNCKGSLENCVVPDRSAIATEGIFNAREAIAIYETMDGMESFIPAIRRLHPFLSVAV